MQDITENTISLTRKLNAPIDVVFAAFTDPALLEQWQAENAEFEAFEGGNFRFETSDDEEDDVMHIVTGTVLTFEQDAKLVEVWRYDGVEEIDETILTVLFKKLSDAETEITISEISDAHEDAQSRIFSIEAWDEALEELAELLE